jgi:hypothetical protein
VIYSDTDSIRYAEFWGRGGRANKDFINKIYGRKETMNDKIAIVISTEGTTEHIPCRGVYKDYANGWLQVLTVEGEQHYKFEYITSWHLIDNDVTKEDLTQAYPNVYQLLNSLKGYKTIMINVNGTKCLLRKDIDDSLGYQRVLGFTLSDCTKTLYITLL